MDTDEHFLGGILRVWHKLLAKDRHAQPEHAVAISGHHLGKCRLILFIAPATDEVLVG